MFVELPDLSVLRRSWTKYADPSTTHRVRVGDVVIGGPEGVVIGGPCAVESFEQTYAIARACKEAGAQLLRGGAYKPRTSPHSFQGLGLDALKILAEVREATGLGFVTEVMDPRLVEQVASYADMLQIGSRSMQNYPLLKEVGQTRKPILFKRGWSATIEEWLGSAEYIAIEGNKNIVLCERGIRASCHSGYARNLLDLNILEPLRQVTPLPVLVDPSHAAGSWSMVPVLGRAALAAGAHGLLVEVVSAPAERGVARCDGEQGITPDVLAELVEAGRVRAAASGAPMAFGAPQG